MLCYVMLSELWTFEHRTVRFPRQYKDVTWLAIYAKQKVKVLQFCHFVCDCMLKLLSVK
jgi:hypothetical protein